MSLLERDQAASWNDRELREEAEATVLKGTTAEVIVKPKSGWPWLGITLAVGLAGLALVIWGIRIVDESVLPAAWMAHGIWISGILLDILAAVLACGFYTLQPNESAVLVLFGSIYKGTVRETGFFWTNPFQVRKKVSLRARNLDGHKLKVNDRRGNPIEIAAVVVWRVEQTAQATFDVEDFRDYARIQSESAVRHLASRYAYDHGEDHEPTLRANLDEVCDALRDELQDRLARAGLVVEEARLTHLAYAPEIAGVMLRRQQAEAIIAARQQIVQGAVGMVESALDELGRRDIVQLDDERRASMVNNLLVILCSEHETNPVVNAGTIY